MKKFLLPLAALLVLAACTNHGKKVKSGNIEVFYKEGIAEAEAQKTAALLERMDTKNSDRKSFQLKKENDTILLRMVIQEEKLKDVTDVNFIAIGNLVSDSIFNGKPVNMDLTDNHFKSIRMVRYKKFEPPMEEKTSADGFGQKFETGNTEVFASGVTDEEANKLVAYLDSYFKPANTYSFQFVKDSFGDYIVRMEANPDKINTLGKEFFTPICKGICNEVLSVPAIQFELTDDKFNTLQVFKYPADTGDSDLNN